MVYLLISPRWEVLIGHLNQPSTSFQIKSFRAQFNFTVRSLSVLFQSSSCIMNETDPLYSSLIVNCVFNAFSAYTAIMCNILTIHAIRKTLSLPKPLKTLLLSLAVSDLGVGFLVQPLYIEWMLNPSHSVYSMGGPLNIIADTHVYASFFGVVVISIDRFLAIHLHLRYQELVTHKRVVAVVISIWVFSAFLSSTRLWTIKIVWHIKIIVQGLCFLCTATVYCKIYFTVRRHINQMQVLQMQVAQNSQMESAVRQKKSAISMFYVYLVFLVCYLPEYFFLVVRLYSALTAYLNDMSSMHILLYLWSLKLLNSSLNPVIYCWKMRNIRNAILGILRNIFLSFSNASQN